MANKRLAATESVEVELRDPVGKYFKGIWNKEHTSSGKTEVEYYFVLPETYWWCHPGAEDARWQNSHWDWEKRFASHKCKDSLSGKEKMRFYPAERLEIIIVCGTLCPCDRREK